MSVCNGKKVLVEIKVLINNDLNHFLRFDSLKETFTNLVIMYCAFT